jgi:hypothetical protein
MVPLAMDEVAGVTGATTIEVRVAEVTVTVVEPSIPLRAAVIEMLPTPMPVTTPSGSGMSLTWAIVSSAEVQLTSVVRSWVVPSLKLPVAVSCTVVPLAIEGSGGVTIIEVSVAALTVTVVEPSIPLRAAAIEVFPTPTPVTSPSGSEVTSPSGCGMLLT